MKTKKQWKISGNQKAGWVIFWGYTTDRGDGFSNLINKGNQPRIWKTLRGATKFGLAHFKKSSSN